MQTKKVKDLKPGDVISRLWKAIVFFTFKSHFEEMYNKGYDDGFDDRKKFQPGYTKLNADYVRGYDDGAKWAKEMCLSEFAKMNNPFNK